jgi:hypothetical protein
MVSRGSTHQRKVILHRSANAKPVKTLSEEQKNSLNNKLEELNSKNSYISKREIEKTKEEMLKHEASEFIKKLKKESKFNV